MKQKMKKKNQFCKKNKMVINCAFIGRTILLSFATLYQILAETFPFLKKILICKFDQFFERGAIYGKPNRIEHFV
jgi:hypothetical protein